MGIGLGALTLRAAPVERGKYAVRGSRIFFYIGTETTPYNSRDLAGAMLMHSVLPAAASAAIADVLSARVGWLP